ncbi:MAG: DUF192 domain-containing protein [Methanobrevibacter sp.]|jgi:uncharacterized membrane protein (UPF0127 family)|nr:DUF192 domain-containing protein [Methanobrevibacter sp.]
MFKKSRKFRELWIEDKEIATVKLADDFSTRLLGLMFKKKIDRPLLFEIPQRFNSPSRSAIHSCFMLVEIIVVFVDENDEVFEIARLKPWQYYKPQKSAKYVIEFNEEDYFKCKLEIGNQIKIKNVQMKNYKL